jgi:hypothetical protein
VRETQASTGDHSHRFPDISDQCSRLTDADGSVQGLSGDTHQLFRVFINVAHGIGFVQVRVQTFGGMLSACGGAGRLRTALTVSVERNVCRTRVFTTRVPSGSVSHVSTQKDTVRAQMASRRTDIDDVSVTQFSPVRDAVADDFVDGPDLGRERTVCLGGNGEDPRADRFRVPAIVEG